MCASMSNRARSGRSGIQRWVPVLSHSGSVTIARRSVAYLFDCDYAAICHYVRQKLTKWCFWVCPDYDKSLQYRRRNAIIISSSVFVQRIFLIVLLAALASAAAAQQLSQPLPFNGERGVAASESAVNPLLSTWGASITSDSVHTEYPRPTLFRSDALPPQKPENQPKKPWWKLW